MEEFMEAAIFFVIFSIYTARKASIKKYFNE